MVSFSKVYLYFYFRLEWENKQDQVSKKVNQISHRLKKNKNISVIMSSNIFFRRRKISRHTNLILSVIFSWIKFY